MHRIFWLITKSKFIITDMVLSLRSGSLDKHIKRVLVSSILFSTSLIPVYADNDDEYVSLMDYETANAYAYWMSQGLTANVTNEYNQTYSTSGTSVITGTFSVSGTITGSDYVTHNITTLYDLHSLTNEWTTWVNENVSIDVASDSGYNAGIKTPAVSCTLTGINYINGEPTGYTMACPAFYNSMNMESYTMTIESPLSANGQLLIGRMKPVYADEEGNLTSGESATSGSSTISLSEYTNENGNISQTASIELTTTTTNVNSLNYVLPVLKGTGNVNNQLRYRFDNVNSADNENIYTLAFLTETSAIASDIISEFTYQFYSNDTWVTVENGLSADFITRNRLYGGYRLITIEIYNANLSNGTDCYVGLNNSSIFSNRGIIPLFVGRKNTMSDNLYRFIYGSDRTLEAINITNDLIENGNTESQAAVDDMDTVTDSFTTTNDDYHNAEVAQLDSMDQALENIDTTDNLVENIDFLSTANWVTLQFNRLVNNTPLELVITFSLILGLALVFIGKVR